MLSAVAMALAFPKAGQAWLAPLGAAGLFWAWRSLSWKRAFFTGWFAGAIFFGINLSWITYTVGSYVGSLAFAVVMIPALVEGLAFALTAVAFRAALLAAPEWLAPAAGAAAFAVFEWLRSIGITGVPFAQVGYSQTSTPLGVFAAYIGCFGVTFVVMLLGGYIAHAVVTRRPATLAAVVLIVAAGWAACFANWPARHMPVPFMRVAAVQGNIAQSIKWSPQTLPKSVARYTELTEKLAPFHPSLIVWPETVVTTDLNDSFFTAIVPRLKQQIPRDASLNTQLAFLARKMNATLVVGSLDIHYGPENLREYNALYTYAPTGALENIYDKRQLVPFVESLPAPRIWSWLPHADLISRLGHGMADSIIPAGPMDFAPLICWESAFPDIIHSQIRNGAQFQVISTDDAWFGKTSGTYQHAQIAQMRAIESGQWVVQAASTGISGIISPAGVWTQSLGVDREGAVAGNVGFPSGSLFARIGPNPVIFGLVVLYGLVLLTGWVLQPALRSSTPLTVTRNDAAD